MAAPGQASCLPGHQLPDTAQQPNGVPLSSLIHLPEGQHLVGALAADDPVAAVASVQVVAAGLADRATIQLSYAIGVAKPLSIYIDTHGTGKVADDKIEKAAAEVMDLTPRGIRKHLDLNKPIYARTSAYGHFGRKAGRDGAGGRVVKEMHGGEGLCRGVRRSPLGEPQPDAQHHPDGRQQQPRVVAYMPERIQHDRRDRKRNGDAEHESPRGVPGGRKARGPHGDPSRQVAEQNQHRRHRDRREARRRDRREYRRERPGEGVSGAGTCARHGFAQMLSATGRGRQAAC